MAYRLKDYLYNDKLTKEQNILMDRLYKLRMSGMAEAFEKQLLEPNTGLEPFEVRFAAIVNQEWDQRESKKFKRLMKKATLKYPAADLDSSIYDPVLYSLAASTVSSTSPAAWAAVPKTASSRRMSRSARSTLPINFPAIFHNAIPRDPENMFLRIMHKLAVQHRQIVRDKLSVAQTHLIPRIVVLYQSCRVTFHL